MRGSPHQNLKTASVHLQDCSDMAHKYKKNHFVKRKKIYFFLVFAALVGFFAIYSYFAKTYPKLSEVKKLSVISKPDVEGCLNTSDRNKCIESILISELHKKGVEGAFATLKYGYEHDKKIASDCHFFAHFIGEEAYKMFKNNEKFALSPNTSYCGFGFYHGFMEALFQESGNIEEARKFCYFADKSLSQYTTRPSTACFHGIGHGAVDGTELAAWGNSQALLEPGLKICEKLDTEQEKYECASGALNSLAIAYSAQKFGLKGDSEHPYYDCTLRKDSYYQHACYEEMNTYVINVSNNDLRKAMAFAEEVGSDKNAVIAAENAAAAAAQTMKTANDFESAARVCQKIQKRLANYCIYGVLEGLIEFGKPSVEYEHSISFCNTKSLTQENRTVCYKKLAEVLRGLNSEKTYEQICQLFPVEYRYICQK